MSSIGISSIADIGRQIAKDKMNAEAGVAIAQSTSASAILWVQ
jgi:TPR repeat protein